VGIASFGEWMLHYKYLCERRDIISSWLTRLNLFVVTRLKEVGFGSAGRWIDSDYHRESSDGFEWCGLMCLFPFQWKSARHGCAFRNDQDNQSLEREHEFMTNVRKNPGVLSGVGSMPGLLCHSHFCVGRQALRDSFWIDCDTARATIRTSAARLIQ
jgi:hypothetical protein